MLFSKRFCASFCDAIWFFPQGRCLERITERERSLAMKRIILLLIHTKEDDDDDMNHPLSLPFSKLGLFVNLFI